MVDVGLGVMILCHSCFFFFSSRRRHTRFDCDWSSDVCSSDLVLLRPGAITRDDIERACGQRPLSKEELQENTPRASGTLLAHYAPNAQVRLMEIGRASCGKECRSRWSPYH